MLTVIGLTLKDGAPCKYNSREGDVWKICFKKRILAMRNVNLDYN